MTKTPPERWPLRASEDVVVFRQAVRRCAEDIGMGTVDRTKLATAASELARNALEHGRGGTGQIEILEGKHRGVRVTISDQGSGISDVEAALKDGFSSGRGMGLGLGGARRLSDAFSLDTSPNGTTLIIERWL